MTVDKQERPMVSVIILSYNRCEDLRRSLQHVYELDYSPFEVIIADNASTDGTREMLAREYPQGTLVALTENIGIAGWNEGAKIGQGEYVLFLDDDSYPEVQTLSMVAGRSLDKSVVYALDVRTVEGDPYAPYLQREQPLRTFIGCGVLMSKYIFERAGRFNASLFLYYHEAEFCLRAYQHGATVCFVPQAIVVHLASPINRKGNGDYTMDRRRAFYFPRNILIILFAYFPSWSIAGRVVRFILGRWSFAACHGRGWVTIQGIVSGISMALKQRQTRVVLDAKVRRLYGNGKYFASFFGDGTVAFQRPRWLSR